MPRSFVRGPLRTIVSSSVSATAQKAAARRAFTTFPVLKSEEASSATNTDQQQQQPKQQQQQRRRPFDNKKRFDNSDRRGSRRADRSSPAAPKFERAPSVKYDTTQPLHFAEPEDWVVSSVLSPRPLYANVASGNADSTSDKMNASLIGTSTVAGLRAHGDLDPYVEQALIQELSEIEKDSSKDHRKAADTKLDYQPFLYEGLSSNFQEILNPKNKINRFNNGGVPGQANIKYEPSSDEVTAATTASTASASTKDEELVERSWKRLEYYGGDYSRPAEPLKYLASKPPQGIKPAGKNGARVLESMSALIGQNQSIGFEDKKKMLRAVQKGLGGY
ncbi:hypothetical protein BGW41_001286 [Actinomortierella wolfii]|nr:hypothetical protein BGW41_001286 [Actinomortierella wolfii]